MQITQFGPLGNNLLLRCERYCWKARKRRSDNKYFSTHYYWPSDFHAAYLADPPRPLPDTLPLYASPAPQMHRACQDHLTSRPIDPTFPPLDLGCEICSSPTGHDVWMSNCSWSPMFVGRFCLPVLISASILSC